VDGMGRIAKKWQEGDSLWFKIEVDPVSVTSAGQRPSTALFLEFRIDLKLSFVVVCAI